MFHAKKHFVLFFFNDSIMNRLLKILLLLIADLLCAHQSISAGNSISICSFNIHYDKENDSIRSWQARKDMVLDLIRTYDFDIVSTQEVKQSQFADFKAMGTYGTIGEGINGGTSGMQNTILYRKSRFTRLDSGVFWLSDHPEIPSRAWDATYARNCAWGKFKDNQTGRIFFIFDAHFDHQGTEAQINSAYLICRKINEMAGEDPAFFMGDLNSEPETETIRYLSKKLTDTREVSVTEPKGTCGTGHGFRINVHVRRIDYIFTTPGKVIVNSFETINKLYNGKAPSDHFPVCISIDFLP